MSSSMAFGPNNLGKWTDYSSGDPDMHIAEKWSPDSIACILRYQGSLLHLFNETVNFSCPLSQFSIIDRNLGNDHMLKQGTF